MFCFQKRPDHWPISIETRQVKQDAFELFEERFSRELGWLVHRAHQSGRAVVKSALRQIRDLKNSLKRDLQRGREIDERVRRCREELICKRLISGGHML